MARTRYPGSMLARRSPLTSARARVKTASIIGLVSRPVNVFCWLGVERAEERQPVTGVPQHVVAEFGQRARVLQAGREAQPQRRVPGEPAEADDELDGGQQLELAHRPRQARVALPRAQSVGRFAGGAQRTAAAIQASCSSSPSSRRVDVGWLANPVRYSEANSQSPERVAGEDPAGCG